MSRAMSEEMACRNCHEEIVKNGRWCDWTHKHGDTHCGAGDGSMADPRHDPHTCRPETCGGIDYDPCPWAVAL